MEESTGGQSLIGRRVGGYQIVAKLGAGGMGVVYKATDVKLDRLVALKFLPPDFSGSRDKERLLQEARAASSLDHPNIGTIYGVEETADGQLFIVMAYYEGETLLDRIRRGPVTAGHVVDVSAQMARGLSQAHEKGVVHRDIKPSNIIITRQGVVKIVDFGLAKLTGGASLTQTGSTLGTAAYMSPEQARGHAVDGRTDIWSAGIVMYQMLTGRLPFRGEHVPSTLYAIVHEPPIPMEGAPPELEHIVTRCLAKEPSQRYQTMDEMLHDLRPLESSPSLATMTMVRQSTAEGAARTTARSQAKGLKLAVAAIVAAVAAGLVLAPPVRRTLGDWLGGAPLEKHIAVLPFSNVGNDPGNQALCDGLMETLTSRLSDLHTSRGSLWVVPSSEVRQRKISDASSAQRTLGATLVVTGSVQRDSRGVRLTVALIDATGPRQLGSAVLDDHSGDFAALQDAAVARLARLMDVPVRPARGRESAAAPAAYESYLKGLGYLRRYDKVGNVDAAIKLFDDARQSDPQFSLAYAGLGEAWRTKYEMTRDVKAIGPATEYCNRAIELNGQLAPAYVTLGRVHDATGQHDLAIQEFQRALELDPRGAEGLLGMARAYESVGRIKEAEDLLKKGAALRPDAWEGYNRLGSFYHRQRRFAEAVKQFQRVLELTPDNSAGYSNLASSYMNLENWEEAQKLLEKAIAITPNYASYSNLGLVYLHRDMFPAAARMFEKALQLNDKDYRLWSNLGLALGYAGSEAKARDAFVRAAAIAEEAAKIQPQDAILQANLGKYYAWLGRRDDALIRVQAALARAPNDLEVHKRVAETYVRLGMSGPAVEATNQAMERGYTWKQVERNRELQPLLKEPGLRRK